MGLEVCPPLLDRRQLLHHRIRQPSLALRCTRSRCRASLAHLRPLLFARRHLMQIESPAHIGIPRVRPPNARRIGHHRLQLRPHPPPPDRSAESCFHNSSTSCAYPSRAASDSASTAPSARGEHHPDKGDEPPCNLPVISTSPPGPAPRAVSSLITRVCPPTAARDIPGAQSSPGPSPSTAPAGLCRSGTRSSQLSGVIISSRLFSTKCARTLLWKNTVHRWSSPQPEIQCDIAHILRAARSCPHSPSSAHGSPR